MKHSIKLFASLLIILLLITKAFSQNLDKEFSLARKAFEQGGYKIAEAYFLNLLTETDKNRYKPDALYYLIKIYKANDEPLKVLNTAFEFLSSYEYSEHCSEVFNIVLKELSAKKAYQIAFEFIRYFDYLINDFTIIEEIGYGLYEQNNYKVARYLFSLCPASDTLNILIAGCTSDLPEKIKYYSLVTGSRGKLYLSECLLNAGDTLAAYKAYQEIKESDMNMNAYLLYRYAKLSRFYNKERGLRSINELKTMSDFKNKAGLLEAIYENRMTQHIIPSDEEECHLIAEFLNQDTTPRLLDSLVLKSLVLDSINSSVIQKLYNESGHCYMLDSMMSVLLLKEGKVEEAYELMAPYLKFCDSQGYVRTIRARKLFKDGEFERAARDLILVQSKEPELNLLLADALFELGTEPYDLYQKVLKTNADSLLSAHARKKIMEIDFNAQRYKRILAQDFESIKYDTSLVRLYIYSLMQTGERYQADSLYNMYFTGDDYTLYNCYGEFLLRKEQYKKAVFYYDSIINAIGDNDYSELYFNRATAYLLQGKLDTAYQYFSDFITRFVDSKEFYRAVFKCATIKYLNQEFDSAGYYYGVATADEALKFDAFDNEIICYKKAERWQKVFELCEEYLPQIIDTPEKEAEINFEAGYACLRRGNVKKAIPYLRKALQMQPSPEYHYWLGEAYLARGDFIRALYQYQQIVDFYPRDEMWRPTAQYKVGIALELIDNIKEAKAVYRKTIKERGIGDIWGQEAQKRLELLDE